MKILLIGSEGFIGRYMIRDLNAVGHAVIGFDLCAQDGGEVLKGGVPTGTPFENDEVPCREYQFVQGNLLDKEALRQAMEGCDLVMNLAAKHHDFGISREVFFQINEAGTKVILEVMTELQVRRLVFYSSVAVYGDVTEESSELTPPKPCNDYGASKLAGERLIQEWAKADGLREVLIIRPVVVYGPHNYANMFRLIDNIYRRRFVMVGKGDNIKSTAYVENLTAATVFVMKSMRPGLEVVNYSDYPQRTSLEIANIIQHELGRKPLSFRVPLGLAMMLAFPFDILAKVMKKNIPITAARIKKFAQMNTWHGSSRVRSLGFQQKATTEEGLKRMVQWYLNEGRLNRSRCASGAKASS